MKAALQAQSDEPAVALDGRVIIVTGGSRGLGREMALALAEAGASLVVTGARQSAALQQSLESLHAVLREGAGAIALAADSTDPKACENMIAETIGRFGRLDALVNNAGLGMRVVSETFNSEPAKFWRTDPEAWNRIIDTNINGSFYAASAAARHMVKQGHGKIINVSTSARTMVRGGYSPYGPSKAALEAASRIWAHDLKGTGVDVNVYLPGGASDTDFIPGGEGRTGADGNLLPASIMRRGIAWLCSAQSDGVTGARFIAKLWDETLPPAQAAKAARTPPTSEPAIL